MKKTVLYFIFLLFAGTTANAQSTLDKLILEDAKTAYTNNNHKLCLEKIDELEKRGQKGLIILHLKIMATSKTNALFLSYEQVAQFKKDVVYYLKNYDNEDFMQQYKEVYEVSKTLSDKKYDEGELAHRKASKYFNDDKDYKNAFEWHIKAHQYGVKNEQSIGYMYEQGLGVEKDVNKAIEWFTKAAEQGNPNAQYNLGVIYGTGKGVEIDYKKAIEWYTKAAAQGYVFAQTNLGRLYAGGVGVETDLDKAIELFKKAIEGGYKNIFYLAFAYEEKGNYKEAYKYFQQGNETGKLGYYFYDGKTTIQDYSKAVEYWEMAGKKAPIYNLCLAVAYYSGKGVQKDTDKAFSLVSGVLEQYKDRDILKKYMKEDGAHNKKHFPHYAQDEAAFFEWLEKEHNIIFEE